MKVDGDGRLYVSGARTARAFVYDRRGRLLRSFDTADGREAFVNDVALTPDGTAYFTDTLRPALFRITRSNLRSPRREGTKLAPWLSFEGSPVVYGTHNGSRNNLNGIVSTRDGRHLFAIQSNTGQLFRITVATKRVVQIPADADLTRGDGLLLRGTRTLYVVRNTVGIVQKLLLSRDFARASSLGQFSDPTFAFPTTIAQVRNRLLLVNSQFNRQREMNPALPFTVSSLALR